LWLPPGRYRCLRAWLGQVGEDGIVGAVQPELELAGRREVCRDWRLDSAVGDVLPGHMELSCLKLGELAVRYRLLLSRADVQRRTLARAEAHDFAACAALFMRVRDAPDQAQRLSSSSATRPVCPE
jgi:hypothetical protein